MKSIMQPLYKFVRFCNLCIAITINLFLVISKWYLELVGLFKYCLTLFGAVVLPQSFSFISLRPKWAVSPSVVPRRVWWRWTRGGYPIIRVLLVVCKLTTLHLGRDDRGKENTVSPPQPLVVSRSELVIGTSLQVRTAQQRLNVTRLCGVGPPHTTTIY